jgi:hypothetical protein
MANTDDPIGVVVQQVGTALDSARREHAERTPQG